TLSTFLPAPAQVAGATLSGVVSDPQGAAIPGARIVARNGANGTTGQSTADATGSWAVPNLIPGDYQITITADGFSSAVARITLSVGEKRELNVALSVGQVSTQLEVAGAAAQVELSTSTTSGNVNSETVRELPLNGRDWASLATLEPSVVEARTHLDVTH